MEAKLELDSCSLELNRKSSIVALMRCLAAHNISFGDKETIDQFLSETVNAKLLAVSDLSGQPCDWFDNSATTWLQFQTLEDKLVFEMIWL